MPPAPATPPSSAEAAAVLAWIDRLIGPQTLATPDPGRVTARRLNRVEYDNTIRDLLGVTIHAAADFPTDDSGYGFDNIGDILSLSPMLMEKLMSAAGRISRAAVFGEAYPQQPSLLIKIKSKRSQDDSPVSGDVFPYSMRGALYGVYHFPVDGDYEFRFRYSNLRPSAYRQASRRAGSAEDRNAADERNRLDAPPVGMVFALDGKPLLTGVVEGNTDYNYARGASVVRSAVTAGDHFLRISFPEFAKLEDPREQINPDGRRKIFADYLDIVGPFHPSAAPPPSYRRIFICGHAPGQHSPECARRVVENLAYRAYRRPVNSAELQPLLNLVALAQNRETPWKKACASPCRRF
jgi:hypothetical protein